MAKGKVLIYRNELLPPSETFILSQANTLARFQPVFAGLKRVNHSLDISSHPVVMLTARETWREKTKRRIFLRTGYANRFVRSIEALEPKIAHAHFAVDSCAALPLVQNLRIPLIVTLHGYDVMCDEATLSRWPSTRAYLRRKEELWQRASVFLCVSEHVRRWALLRGFPEEKLQVHHIGVDLARFTPPDQYAREKIVLFVGRLVEKKGCIHLIRAMAHVQKEIPEARLVIVGEGPLSMLLQQEAARHLSSCLFLGQRSHEEVPEWMQRARLLVAPSIRAKNGDAEGLPSVLCEAQAMGLPPVTFETDGVIEALPEERRVSMPREQDEAALAEEIKRLLHDDERWQHASTLGRRYMEAGFDLVRQTRLLEDIYDGVMARRHD